MVWISEGWRWWKDCDAWVILEVVEMEKRRCGLWEMGGIYFKPVVKSLYNMSYVTYILLICI